jgi:4-amino-4-deoxy-L-arabinose transferase-like glycosyltransferase
MTRWVRWSVWALIPVSYLILAFSAAATNNISTNEAWFASPALNLLHKGFLGATVIEPAGTWLAGIERHTYWVPPAHLLLQTCWYGLFGFSLFTLRALSIFWGLVLLASLCTLLWKLCGRTDVAWLAAALLVIDGRFLTFSSCGRMDAMCAGMGFASWAAYVCLRERSLGTATFVSHSLAAASCLTHPCGLLYAVGLAILALLHDRSRIRWRHLLAAGVPYLMGLALWGIYILQDPVSFHRQFTGNVSGIAGEFTTSTRWSGLLSPLAAFKREFFLRYGSMFGWYESGLSPNRLQLLVLLAYTLGVLGTLATASLRRRAGSRTLLTLGAFFFCTLALFDGLKSVWYLLHTLPFCAALLALTALQAASTGSSIRRRCAVAGLVALAGLQFITAARNARIQPVRWDYASAVQYLQHHAPPSAMVMGPAELAFALGFDANFVDDVRLGYHTGRTPDFIVMNSLYRDWHARSALTYPDVHADVRHVLASRYVMVFRNSSYSIYRRS